VTVATLYWRVGFFALQITTLYTNYARIDSFMDRFNTIWRLHVRPATAWDTLIATFFSRS